MNAEYLYFSKIIIFILPIRTAVRFHHTQNSSHEEEHQNGIQQNILWQSNTARICKKTHNNIKKACGSEVNVRLQEASFLSVVKTRETREILETEADQNISTSTWVTNGKKKNLKKTGSTTLSVKHHLGGAANIFRRRGLQTAMIYLLRHQHGARGCYRRSHLSDVT